MKKKPELKIDWATHEAAKYACETWHYTGKIPVNKLVKIGAWENGKFIGVVIFGMGASAVVHKQFGVDRFECCELVRVALSAHESPVSRIVAIALKFLKRANPKLRVCVSFADPAQGHHGGIYQAGNWLYTGQSSPTVEYFFNGDWRHVTDVYKRLPPEKVKTLRKRSKAGKYRYVMPFDDEMRRQISIDSKAYPKRAGSKDLVAPPDQGGEEASEAIPALQNQQRRKLAGKKGARNG